MTQLEKVLSILDTILYPSDDDLPFCDCDSDDCESCDELYDDGEYEEDVPFWGIPDIRKIIFNPPATVVYWDDGTKTVVKCIEGQPYEKYAGFCAACMKKMFGSTARAKAIMEECDVDTWNQLLKEEAEFQKQNLSEKKPEPASKSISIDDLITAFTKAVEEVVKSKGK